MSEAVSTDRQNNRGRRWRWCLPATALGAAIVVFFVAAGRVASTRPGGTPAAESQVAAPAVAAADTAARDPAGAQQSAVPDRSAPPKQDQVAASAATRDEQYRRLALGKWQDEYQGKRTLTLRADGTGTMLVELSGLTATLVAAQLRFDMQWSIEGGHLKMHSLGGEPQRQVEWVLKTIGDKVDQPILELTEGRLLLLDQDGKTKYDWRRANAAE